MIPVKLYSYVVSVVRLVQRLHRRFQPSYVASSVHHDTAEETQVVGVPLGRFGVYFQIDAGYDVVYAGGKGQTYATERTIDGD